MSGPRTSLAFTKTMRDFGTISSPMVRSSKLMMAAMRLRSLLDKILCGVRCKTPIKSSRDFGVYFVGFGAGFGARNFSSFGSSQRTRLRMMFSNIYNYYNMVFQFEVVRLGLVPRSATENWNTML